MFPVLGKIRGRFFRPEKNKGAIPCGKIPQAGVSFIVREDFCWNSKH
jgi:hypothetical protein